MITQTFKMQFQCDMWITRHTSIWIANNIIHCSLHPNNENLQKVCHDIVIFSGNVLGHAWHTWCKKGTNGKRMSYSLLICHMQIFKSIDFRTIGLWIWITFFFYTHCIGRSTCTVCNGWKVCDLGKVELRMDLPLHLSILVMQECYKL